MTTNHPANGPVSLDRLHQISEILSKAAAQSDGGNIGYAMADAVKVIDEAIAAFDAEPVAWQWEYRDKRHVTNDQRRAKIVAEDGEVLVQPLYTAPAAPVVPDEKPMPNPLKMYAVDAVAAIAEVRGWNACRAAMLQAGNSPVTPDGWIPVSERMPKDAQWCVVNTEYGYYVQCWSEGQGWLGDDTSIPECDVINWIPLPEPKREMK
ncbi:DUF551 domain-containing protein [Citrobacter sp. VF227]